MINGHLHTLTATKEVILSAGAFNSPQILMLSGIGDASILQQHNIALKHHLPGVGKNLQDHVDALVVTHCKRTDLLAYRPKALWFGLKQAWQYWQHKTGLLSSPVAEAGGFVKSAPGVERPDIQLHCIPAAMDDHGRNHAMLMHYGISIHACLLRPNSRGFVSLNSNNPNDDPFIQLNMLSDQQDQQTMIQAVRLVRNILAQPPLQQQVYQEIFPGEQCQSDDDILQFLKQKANTIYHPVGTCKMGVDDLSVVNADLQVHGVNQLRVVDASIMPTLISGNTNAPTIMIAAKIADVILKQHYQC
jgi:choline dehydrogenase-like flavoprotein